MLFHTGGGSSGEPSRECEGTYSLLREEDGASTNHNSEKEKKKENREQGRETDDNNGYKLLCSDEKKLADGLRENVYHTPDEQEEDKDYEDPDDDRNNDYYVLEPVGEEDGEREVKGASAGECEYEVPVILDKKRKTKY